MRKTWLRARQSTLQYILHLLEIFVLVGGLYFALLQIKELRKTNEAQISLEVVRDIYSGERYKKNPLIIKLLERGQPILIENGGQVEEEELDNILGEWEWIARMNQLEVLSDDLVYQQFSYDIILASKNKEIMDYVSKIRKLNKDSNFFADFEWLAKKMEYLSKP